MAVAQARPPPPWKHMFRRSPSIMNGKIHFIPLVPWHTEIGKKLWKLLLLYFFLFLNVIYFWLLMVLFSYYDTFLHYNYSLQITCCYFLSLSFRAGRSPFNRLRNEPDFSFLVDRSWNACRFFFFNSPGVPFPSRASCIVIVIVHPNRRDKLWREERGERLRESFIRIKERERPGFDPSTLGMEVFCADH